MYHNTMFSLIPEVNVNTKAKLGYQNTGRTVINLPNPTPIFNLFILTIINQCFYTREVLFVFY